MKQTAQRLLTIMTCLIFAGSVTAAKPEDTATEISGGEDASDLAQKLSKPVANLISIPIQANLDDNFVLPKS